MDDAGNLSSLSLIDEHDGRHVRMGHLAFLGSHKVNGVSRLHTDLVKETVFRDLQRIFPDRIVNKTNGITFRRWLFEANPRLTRLLVETIGEGAGRSDGAGEARSASPTIWISRSATPPPGTSTRRRSPKSSPTG